MLNRFSKRVMYNLNNRFAFHFSMTRTTNHRTTHPRCISFDTLDRLANRYFNFLIRHKTHIHQYCVSKEHILDALNEDGVTIFEEENQYYLQLISEKIDEIKNWIDNADSCGYDYELRKNIKDLKQSFTFLKKYLVVEENLSNPEMFKILERAKIEFKRLLNLMDENYKYHTFGQIKTILKIYSILAEYNIITQKTFNKEIIEWIEFSKEHNLYIMTSALLEILNTNSPMISIRTKDCIINTVASLNINVYKNVNDGQAIYITEDLIRCLNYGSEIYENLNFSKQIIEIFQSEYFMNCIKKALEIKRYDIISRYLVGIQKFRLLWASNTNYPEMVLEIVEKILKNIALKNSTIANTNNNDLLHIALMLNFLGKVIDKNNENHIDRFKTTINNVIDQESSYKLLKKGINTFYKELLEATMHSEKLIIHMKPEIHRIINCLNQDRELYTAPFIQSICLLFEYYFETLKEIGFDLNIIDALIDRMGTYVSNNYKKIGLRTLNSYAKLIFIQGIARHEKTFAILAEYNNNPLNMHHYIYSLNFWSHFLLTCNEDEVSTYSINLQIFLYRIDIKKLIDEFFEKYKNNPTEYIRLIERLEFLYKNIKKENKKRDKHANYRAKPLKRSFEMIFIQMLQKLMDNNQQMYELFVNNTQQLRAFLAMLKHVVQLVSTYNVKFYENINEVIFDIFKMNKNKFDLQAKCNFFVILASQNYHSKYSEYIYVQIFNAIVDELEDSKQNLGFLLNIVASTRAFYLLHDIEGMKLNKLGKIFVNYLNNTKLSTQFDSFSYACGLLALLPVKIPSSVVKNLDAQIKTELPQIRTFIISKKRHGYMKVLDIYRLVAVLRYTSRSRFLSDEAYQIVKSFLYGYLKLVKEDNFSSPTSSHVQGQIELILNRAGIEYESEVSFGLGFQDLMIKPNIIIEIAGNVHFFNQKVDLKLQSNLKLFKKMGYQYIIINDYEFTQSVNKNEFLKNKCNLSFIQNVPADNVNN